MTEFSTGLTVANAPADITTGPDGNLWFTEQGILQGIGRITPTGSTTALLALPAAAQGTPVTEFSVTLETGTFSPWPGLFCAAQKRATGPGLSVAGS